MLLAYGKEANLIALCIQKAKTVYMIRADLPIQFDPGKLADFCRQRGIRKLSLFGSVLREDFDPVRSDVDVLVEFSPDALEGVGFRYFGYQDELSKLLGHRVDFCSHLNKHIEPSVRREAVTLYEVA